MYFLRSLSRAVCFRLMLNVDVLIRTLSNDKLVRWGASTIYQNGNDFGFFVPRISDLGSNGNDSEIFVPGTGFRSVSGSANTPAASSKQAAHRVIRADIPLCTEL